MYKKIALAGLALSLFVLPATSLAVNVSQISEAIPVSKTLSVGLNFTPATVTNSNPLVTSVNVESSGVRVNGLSVGTSAIYVCDSTQSNCLNITVAVTGSVLGAVTYFDSHPAGSWVIEGKTVYYITSMGIIPITTWDIFLNNGGKASAIQPISQGDMYLALLPFMTYNDSRVK